MSDSPKTDYGHLVDAYYQGLYRFAHSLAGNPHEAADLTQQTFLIYARKGDAIREAAKVKSWLFTTLYREFLRQRKRNQTMISTDNEILDSHTPAEAPRVARELDGKDALEALAAVDPVYRVPLTLYYLQDLSYREIATMLGIPLGTVMSRLSRGKEQLKHAFHTRPAPCPPDSP